MTLMDLQALLPILKSFGVKSYREGELELSFFDSKTPKENSEQTSNVAGFRTEKINDVVVPTSLEEEPSMTIDKILNWSVESDTPVPLTGVGETNVR